jgi:hypothetical protein
MKDERLAYLLGAMLVSLSKAKTHLNVGLAFSIAGIVYMVAFLIYEFYGETSTLSFLFVWGTSIVIYLAQSRARREYNRHMEEYNKLNEEYEDLISR